MTTSVSYSCISSVAIEASIFKRQNTSEAGEKFKMSRKKLYFEGDILQVKPEPAVDVSKVHHRLNEILTEHLQEEK